MTEAAEAAGVSVQRAREWVRRARAGDCELVDRRSGPRGRPPGRVCPAREAVIAELRGGVRMNAVEIAAALGMAERTVRAVINRLDLSKLAPLEEPGASQPLRAAAARRPDPHRRQEARPDRSARPPRQRRPHHQVARDRLGVCSRLCRRLHPAGLRRGARRRTPGDRHRLPAASGRVVQSAGRHDRATDDRQWARLPLQAAPQGLRGTRHPPSLHPPLPAAHQRQGRALHPHPCSTAGPTSDPTPPAPNAAKRSPPS